MKYYAVTFQNGLTYYVKSDCILNAVKTSRGLCSRVVKVRILTPEEYVFRKGYKNERTC